MNQIKKSGPPNSRRSFSEAAEGAVAWAVVSCGLCNMRWVTHGSGIHQLFRVDGMIEDGAGHAVVTAYTVRRPDGHWALLLVNKDQDNARDTEVVFRYSAAGRTGYFAGSIAHGHLWQRAVRMTVG